MNLKDVFELMKLCKEAKPQMTSRQIRTLLTHTFPEVLNEYTIFTGKVSQAAIEEVQSMAGVYRGHRVVREHPNRIQRELTTFFDSIQIWDYETFEDKVRFLSEINITSSSENSKLNAKDASYESLGIELIPWDKIESDVRSILKKYVLTSKVKNRHNFNI